MVPDLNKRIVVMFFFIFSVLIGQSQITSLSWVKQFGGVNIESGLSVTTDKFGNVYTTGYFGSIIDFDPGPSTFTLQSAGNKDIFISKLNAAGTFVWAKRIGNGDDDVGRSIVVDSIGNVYVSGSFQNTVDFDPGPGSFTLATPNSNDDVFILKLNSSGNFVWAGQQGGIFVDVCYSVVVDNKGYLYNTGTFGSTADFNPGVGTFTLASSGSDDIFITKLDTAGKLIWAKQIGGSNQDVCYSLALDKNSKPYCTGNFNGTVDFDPGPGVFNMITSSGSPNIFVLKLDSAGIFKWAKNMGGSGAETGKSICVDNFGSVYTTGYFNNTVDFDPGPSSYTIASSGSWDAYVSKLDTNGNFRWAKSFGALSDQFGSAVTTDLSGNIYSVGNFENSVDFDPGSSTFTMSAAVHDVYISKLDSTGNFVFAKQLVGAWDANSVAEDSLFNIYITGSFSNITDFDPSPVTYTLSSVSSFDAYVLKIGQCIVPVAPVNTTTSLTSCEPGAFTLTASCPTGTINWFSGVTSTVVFASGPTYSVSGLTAGNYTFYAEALTCTTSISRTPVSVTVNPLPTIIITNTAICSGDSYTLSPTGANTYSFSSGTSIVSPTATTIFSVTGTNSFGCITPFATAVTVSVNPLPLVSANSSNSLICGPPYQGSVTLTGNGANSYTWNPGGPGTNIIVSPSVTTAYTVTGTDVNGCMNNAMITQSVSACTGINLITIGENKILIYPNPNNGIFTIQSDFEGYLSINDVLGNEIYSEKSFKGRYVFSDTEMPSGLYFVKLSNKEYTRIIKLIKQ